MSGNQLQTVTNNPSEVPLGSKVTIDMENVLTGIWECKGPYGIFADAKNIRFFNSSAEKELIVAPTDRSRTFTIVG